ncbi:GPI ethanolamine phosphate transferase 1 isoform X2 [Ptiloglossa arizonensis]|uniref:GPI ethanolamine phosphate transferase 1 isoform X2 n=1 Tax=Ptiloglossa arizonensis TaxID=3350558 RepID=UPI003F9FC9E2
MMLHTSESITLDLLTFEDLELLRARRFERNSCSSLSNTTNNRRYLILTYTVEFDRIHYPLPLEYCGLPDPVILQSTIRRLQAEIEKLQSIGVNKNLQKRIEQLTTANQRLVQENQRLASGELPSVPVLENAPAKRLVLFVADGLRFRTFIESPPKFLKYVMTYKGVWGVSHTRLPTESRPGIVAICAGLYEDPSAIFKGWKENPVDFDSIFNQSHFSWAWGSSDIIPMFTKGTKGNVYGDSYPHEWQDFDIMQGQIWRLDSWVFDKYLNWLQEEAQKVKNVKRIILFLHLLGCDTTGHAAKPNSREYIENMNYVDHKIEEVVQMTENIFGDNATAYIFTADHGMTNWGSHGSGSTDETETPLIVWGAGINAFSSRQDVEQVDITPLISTLIGAPIPSNSEGVLPWQYLNDTDLKYINHALLNNLKQLTYQVKANREMNCENNRFSDWKEIELDYKISILDKYLREKNLREKLIEIVDTIELAKESLSYFRQYQRLRFLIYLSIMWLGWIILLFFKIAGAKRLIINRNALLVADITFISILITIFIMHKVSDCRNWRLPCYGSLATISFWFAIRSIIMYSIKLRFQNDKHLWVKVIGIILLLAIIFMGLTYRFILSVGILCTALIQNMILKKTRNFCWTAVFLAVFPLLPVVEPYPRIYIVFFSICIVTIIVALQIQSKYRKAVDIFRLIITGLTCLEFIDGRSWVSWAILLTTPLQICTYSIELKERMQGVMLGFFCPLTLLSTSYEPFFFIFLALHLSCWPQSNVLPNQSYQRTKNILTVEELLKATIFMLYTLLCFFGTGNMASISSFDPSWTRHFVTIFSPFLMFSLILLKISIPLILIGCASHIHGFPNIFLAVLLLGDCLSLPHIYCVTPQGSWLDIGSAISRFTIIISLPCLLLLLYYLSYPLMTFIPNKFKSHMVLEKTHVV